VELMGIPTGNGSLLVIFGSPMTCEVWELEATSWPQSRQGDGSEGATALG
jgi:hypothetical protein